jgi:hypothetical protein
MPSYVLILSLIAVSLSIAIFLIFMRNEAPAPIFPENPSDIWDEPAATTALASVGESNRILFRNSIERIQQKIHPIAIGALCNVLHDPSFEQLLDEILVFGDVNCKYVIELLEHTRELAIKEMEKNNDIYSPKRNELDEAGRLVIDELTIFITKLIEINCVEDVIKAAVIRELVINSRDDACRGLEISASVLSDFLGNMLNSETNDRTFPNWTVATTPAATTGMPTWGAATTAVATTPAATTGMSTWGAATTAVATTPAATTGMPTWGAATTAVATTPAATTGMPTWGAATTAVATQYSSNPVYHHCNEVLQGTNDENEQIQYAMFFKDINSKETSKRKILELLGGNVHIRSGISNGNIQHPDVHFIVLDKTQLEILLSDNQSPILSIECPIVLSNTTIRRCTAIGCEEEAMYPHTFEKSRNLYYNLPRGAATAAVATTPAATTGMPTWGAATTAVATQYSSNPEYYHCNQVLQGTNEQRDMGYGIWDMGYGIDENEQIKYAMFFKDNTNENSKETSIRKILELLGGNVNIFSGYESFQKIEHPDVHFIVLNKIQLEILLSDNQSPILSIECPVVSSNDLSCAEIGCEEEAMYPRTFEKSRNLYYNRPTEPAATTGRPRFEDDNFHNIG